MPNETPPPSGTVAVLVLVRDPDQSSLVASGILRAALGMAEAEANTVTRIVAGATPAELATARGVGIDTVRTHLKRAMAKAQVTRQVDLVALVLRMASGPAS